MTIHAVDANRTQASRPDVQPGLNALNDSSVVFQRFSGLLVGLAQRRLVWKYKKKLDPEDVVKSAFMSFFRMRSEVTMAFEIGTRSGADSH